MSSNNQLELPILPFSSPEFLKAWDDWLSHRKEIKKPITPTSQRLQLQKLGRMREKDAIATLHNTIEKGWQGLREPDGKKMEPPRPAQVDGPRPKGNAPDELYVMGAEALKAFRKGLNNATQNPA